MKTILLYSGGLDSTAARYILKPDALLYVDLGVEYSAKERAALPVDVWVVSAQSMVTTISKRSQHVPFRNMIFAEIAYNQAVARWPDEDVIRVAVIGVKEDATEDKTKQAFQIMSAALNAIRPKGGPLIDIFSPFWDTTKAQLVVWLKANRLDWEAILKEIVTCFSADGKRCGKCWACVAYATTLTLAGIECRKWFESDVVQTAKEQLMIKDWVSLIWADEITRAIQIWNKI